jgi:DNA-binding beta-propeller fold protein YncE
MHAKTGIYIKDLTNITQDAHNSYTGETGKYMYLSARSGGPLYLVDQATTNVVKTIGPFSSPVRPFSVTADETFFFANLTNLQGFAVGNIATGKIIEVTHPTPSARAQTPGASAGVAHGDDPKSHGIAVRPGGKEVWWLDDEFGYLYVYDITTMPPTHLADVPLFTDIAKPWGFGAFRWVAFDTEGQYVYPSDGSVVDAKARAVIPNVHITPSEKLLEVDFQNGKPVRIGGQNGGVYK